nr:FAD-dependent monooxygenase [Nocardioides convexus]
MRSHTVNQGLRAHGFGQTLHLPWPGGHLPEWGSAIPRTELDDHLRTTAVDAGAVPLDGARAVDVRRDGDRVSAVVFKDGREVECRRLVVADGVRSPLGKVLGREWHRDTVYGVAGRCYVKSTRADDPWIRLAPGVCATGRTRSSAATAGSSRSARGPARSTSARARSPRRSGPRTSRSSR